MKGWFSNRIKSLTLLSVMVFLLVAMTGCDDLESFSAIFVSLSEAGTTEDGVDYSVEDILMIYDDGEEFTEENWQKIFEGSEYGLTTRHNISAFSFNEVLWYNLIISGTVAPDDIEFVPELYLSFQPNGVIVPGIPTKVAGNDIVRFTEISPADPEHPFELYFDGSDVGLTTVSEKIDGLGVWPPEYYEMWISANVDLELPYDCNAGVIFVTTQGAYRVPAAVGGSIVGTGSDVLLFCAFNTGSSTSGVWYRVFNAKKEGITPWHASVSLDVLGFELNGISEQAPDLDAGVLFAFTPRVPFNHPNLDEPGQPGQLFFAATGGGVEGPFEFNDSDIPALNGVIDSIGLFDIPAAP